VLPLASLDLVREAEAADEVKGLGKTPIIASFSLVTGGKVEVAMASLEQPVGLKPWNIPDRPASTSPSAAGASA